MPGWQPIVPSDAERAYDRLHFAPAVRVGDTIHVSGVIGRAADGSVSDDPDAQFDQAFANLAATVAACGATLADVAELTSFHVGLQQHLRAFMKAKDRALPTHPPSPAWTAIGVVELALPGALVELRVTLAAPGA
jgi:enamine deaminase RidA (YjgF/YER057c/UK114 family)